MDFHYYVLKQLYLAMNFSTLGGRQKTYTSNYFCIKNSLWKLFQWIGHKSGVVIQGGNSKKTDLKFSLNIWKSKKVGNTDVVSYLRMYLTR